MRGKYKLSAVFIKFAPPGKYNDGAGLWFVKRNDGGGQWVLRVTVHGKRREMGLGSILDVSLKKARELAEHWRAMAVIGVDPIKEREKERKNLARNDNSLEKVAIDAFEARKAELKGDGKNGRWFSPIRLHILPKLGKVPVEEVSGRDIRDILLPIWHTKSDTARKALNRLGIVLKYAAALGLDVDLQATEKAKALLGKSRHTPKHIPAMTWSEVPNFYKSLNELTLTHLALRLLILTGARSGSLRYMRLEQIEGDIWTIPAENMKGRKDKTDDFRIPLSGEAKVVIEKARCFERDGYLFPSVRKGVISDATMARHMERRGLVERPHGFRSSLRTWMSEVLDASRDVSEKALAHKTGTSVERAYRRTDYLEQRQEIMNLWANFVTGAEDNSKQG